MESYLTPQMNGSFSDLHIPQGNAEIYRLTNGELLLQSDQGVPVRTTLFESQLTGKEYFKFEQPQSTISMHLVFDGQASLYDEAGESIISITAPCFLMTHMPQGSYNLKLDRGSTKLIIFTIQPEWFVHKMHKKVKFQPLIAQFNNKSKEACLLPQCLIKTKFLRRLERLFSASSKKSNSGCSETSDFLYDLFIDYHQMLVYKNYGKNATEQAIAEKLTAYLNEHFRDHDIGNIASIADHLGEHPKVLSRISITYSGLSIKKRIINLKLEYAKALISGTKMKIKQIALEAGYSDPDHFSRSFKKKFKQSPAHYRNSL